MPVNGGHGSTSLALPAVNKPRSLELEVGDLVMWHGKPLEHATFKHGVIYRVIAKKAPEDTTYLSQYQFQVAFDFSNPVGVPVDSFGFSTTRELKRLSLLDVCTLRLHFDNFIREWARLNGEANPDDVR